VEADAAKADCRQRKLSLLGAPEPGEMVSLSVSPDSMSSVPSRGTLDFFVGHRRRANARSATGWLARRLARYFAAIRAALVSCSIGWLSTLTGLGQAPQRKPACCRGSCGTRPVDMERRIAKSRFASAGGPIKPRGHRTFNEGGGPLTSRLGVVTKTGGPAFGFHLLQERKGSKDIVTVAKAFPCFASCN